MKAVIVSKFNSILIVLALVMSLFTLTTASTTISVANADSRCSYNSHWIYHAPFAHNDTHVYHSRVTYTQNGTTYRSWVHRNQNHGGTFGARICPA